MDVLKPVRDELKRLRNTNTKLRDRLGRVEECTISINSDMYCNYGKKNPVPVKVVKKWLSQISKIAKI